MTKEATEVKKETVQIETRQDVKTYFFPPEAVKSAQDGKVKGFTLAGYELAGKDVKVFVPKFKDGVEAKQLTNSKNYPNYLVVSLPKTAELKGFYVVEDNTMPNGERYEGGLKLNTKVLDELQKMYSKDKAPAQRTSENTEVKESEKPAEEKPSEKPIWVRPECVQPLRNGQGFFIKGFEHGEEKDLAIMVSAKAENLSSRKLKNWYMITAEKDARFDLYRPVKGKEITYEKTGNFIRTDTLRFKMYELNQAAEKALKAKQKEVGVSLEK